MTDSARKPRATRVLHAAVDAEDKYPLAAWGVGLGLVVWGLMKLQGPPMYVAVVIGVACCPPLKKSVIGLVAGLAPFVPGLRKGDKEPSDSEGSR